MVDIGILYICFLDVVTALVGSASDLLVPARMPPPFRSARHQRLAELIAQYRREAGLKQADVARELGRHQPFITSIENGQRRIDVVEFLQLARIIGFDPHDVLHMLAAIEYE